MRAIVALRKQAARGIERGAIVIVAAIACIALTALMALAIDAAGYYTQLSRQVNASEAVKQAVGAEATLINNESKPGREIAETAVRLLRENGVAGEVTVHFWEATDKATRTDRYLAYAVEVDGTYRTMLGAVVGIETLDVRSTVFDQMQFYSSDVVWRPNWSNPGDADAYAVDNGSFTWAAGLPASSEPAFKPATTLGAFPATVSDGFRAIFGE